MTSRNAQRGFSLTELLIAAVVMAIVAAGGLGLMNTQQRAFRQSAGDRALQESARAALSEVGMNLRRAGYGVDPWLAIDFGPLSAAPALNLSYQSGPPGGTRVDCATSPVGCRDSTSASDEIVFYARDPAFSRFVGAGPSTTQITLSTALTSPLLKGQILQVMCSGAADWAYVTVSSTSTDLTTVNLDTSVTGRFPYQQSKLATGCLSKFGGQSVAVFKVDRFHYYVATYAEGGYPTGRPYLMLDRGLLDASNNPILEPVAPDVEDIQFAYAFLSGSVVGKPGDALLAETATGVDLEARPPPYDADTTDTLRTSNSPANIRAVRVSVVVRSSSYDSDLTTGDATTIPAAGNRDANTSAPSGYRRLLVETTEATRNLDSRSAFMPPFTQNSGADGLNVGGG